MSALAFLCWHVLLNAARTSFRTPSRALLSTLALFVMAGVFEASIRIAQVPGGLAEAATATALPGVIEPLTRAVLAELARPRDAQLLLTHTFLALVLLNGGMIAFRRADVDVLFATPQPPLLVYGALASRNLAVYPVYLAFACTSFYALGLVSPAPRAGWRELWQLLVYAGLLLMMHLALTVLDHALRLSEAHAPVRAWRPRAWLSVAIGVVAASALLPPAAAPRLHTSLLWVATPLRALGDAAYLGTRGWSGALTAGIVFWTVLLTAGLGHLHNHREALLEHATSQAQRTGTPPPGPTDWRRWLAPGASRSAGVAALVVHRLCVELRACPHGVAAVALLPPVIAAGAEALRRFVGQAGAELPREMVVAYGFGALLLLMVESALRGAAELMKRIDLLKPMPRPSWQLVLIEAAPTTALAAVTCASAAGFAIVMQPHDLASWLLGLSALVTATPAVVAAVLAIGLRTGGRDLVRRLARPVVSYAAALFLLAPGLAVTAVVHLLGRTDGAAVAALLIVAFNGVLAVGSLSLAGRAFAATPVDA